MLMSDEEANLRQHSNSPPHLLPLRRHLAPNMMAVGNEGACHSISLVDDGAQPFLSRCHLPRVIRGCFETDGALKTSLCGFWIYL